MVSQSFESTQRYPDSEHAFVGHTRFVMFDLHGDRICNTSIGLGVFTCTIGLPTQSNISLCIHMNNKKSTEV